MDELEKLIRTSASSIYDKFVLKRKLFLLGEITAESATQLIAQFLWLDLECKDPITLYINSIGGDIDTGLFPIYDVIQNLESPVSTVAIGQAYSSAGFILAAGTKGMRYANPNAQIMLHSAQISELAGSQPEVERETKNIKKVQNTIMEIVSKHSGQNLRKVKRDFKTDKYFSVKEALDYGLIDHVLTK